MDLRTCSDVVVVASARHALDLSSLAASDLFPGLTIIELEAQQPIPDEAFRSASLAVIEVDPACPNSMDRLAAFHRTHAPMPIIAAIPDASVALVRSLVREGVADVISLPFGAEDLLESALNVLAERSVRNVAEQRLAPMISVVRSIGGCGATSIATHLAGSLARQGGARARAIVVDLDLQFGSVADFVAAEGRGTIADLLEAGNRLDEDLVRSIVRETEDGIGVVAAPVEIMPLESVDTDQLLRVLDQIRRNCDFVVLDLPANWTNWALSAALASNVVLLVVELTIASLRQAKRRLELFKSVGIAADNIAIVVNRLEKRLFRTIDLDDVAQTLRHPAFASLALDEPALNAAQDQGRLVQSVRRKSTFGADIDRLATTLLDGRLGERK